MTTKIRTLGPGVLKSTDPTNARDLSADVTKVMLNPSNSSDDAVNFLDGSSEVNTTTSWTLDATVMDDYTPGGINQWCLDNAGKTIPMRFIPTSGAGGNAYAFDATVTPIGIGGDVKAKNTQDISWPITNLQSAPEGDLPVTAITLSPATVTVAVGKSKQVTASLTPSEATAPVSWKSNDILVSSVDKQGMVWGKKVGTATITATAGGKTATVPVTVTPAASSSQDSTTGHPSAE